MTRDQINTAMAEARRFIKRADEAVKSMDEYSEITGNKHTGACKRASMDLTRALADMRRNPHESR